MEAAEMNAKVLRRALKIDYLSQPVLGHIQLGLFTVGALFWIQATIQEKAFSEALYGSFALTFSAESWAIAMMAPAAMVWIGLRHPVKRWMVAVGSMMQIVQFVALGYSALYTGGEPIIGIFCIVLFAPLYSRILGEALIDP